MDPCFLRNEEKNKLINDLNQLQKSQQSMKQDYDNAIMQFKQQQEKQQISLQEKLIRSENEHKLSKKSQVQLVKVLVLVKEFASFLVNEFCIMLTF